MIRAPIRSLAPALALIGLLAAPADAQEARAALRANVTVSSDIVRIGDLVENAGAVADVPIFQAPDLGTRGAVATERVLEAIAPHHLIGIDTRGLAEVIVTRASRAITAQEISARIARALEGQYGLGEARSIAVNFDHAVRTLHVEADAGGDLELADLSYDPRTTRFAVTFDLPSSAIMHRFAPRYTGTAVAMADVVTVDHPLERGEVLKASELVIQRRPKSEGPALSDINAAAGQAARHQLRPGQPIHEADLMKPAIVQRNDSVSIVYEAPGIVLTLRGQAQESGGLGDQISVTNPQSKRVFQGTITAPGRVTVTAPATRVVASAPTAVVESPAPSTEDPQSDHSVSSTE